MVVHLLVTPVLAAVDVTRVDAHERVDQEAGIRDEGEGGVDDEDWREEGRERGRVRRGVRAGRAAGRGGGGGGGGGGREGRWEGKGLVQKNGVVVWEQI